MRVQSAIGGNGVCGVAASISGDADLIVVIASVEDAVFHTEGRIELTSASGSAQLNAVMTGVSVEFGIAHGPGIGAETIGVSANADDVIAGASVGC